MNQVEIDSVEIDSKAKHLAEKFGLNPLIVKILLNRGFDSEEKIDKFLNVDEKQLNNPFLLRNMDVLCDRIKLAINRNESIVVFGDYDVDGISASYMLWDHLKSLHANVNYFLPCRIADGYGLTMSTLNQVNEKFNPSLIITVDCGISCRKEVEYAKSMGIEILVTDHHEIPSDAPDVFVNAKFSGQDYPYQSLCGAGLVFKIIHALSGFEACKKYLPIAAIATIADIVPLTDENRAIVKLGLECENMLPIGLKKLIKNCGISSISAKEISFKVAPKINAPGRMGDPDLAMKLYTETDENKINKIIDEIFSVNEKRQQICNEMYDECVSLLKNYDLKSKKIIILKSPNQDKGLLGIIAARVCGEFGRPTIIFNEDGDVLKGSCRSIEGINCVKLFEFTSSLLEGYGGHSMAGGLSLKLQNFKQFCDKCDEFLASGEFDNCFKEKKSFDLEVNINKLNLQFAKQLRLLEPTGCENKLPIFKVNFTNCLVVQNKSFLNHFYVKIGGENLTAFNFLPYYDLIKNPLKKAAFVEVALETYKGKTDVKRYIRDVEIASKPSDKDYKFYHLLNLEKQPNFESLGTKISIDQLKEYRRNSLWTLFVVGSDEELEFAKNNFENLDFEYFTFSSLSPASKVIVAPTSFNNFSSFKKVVFLHKPSQTLVKMLHDSGVECEFCDEITKSKTFYFDKRRETFAKYFKLFKTKLNVKNNFVTFKDFIDYVADENIGQIIYCFKVFSDLNIIKQEETEGKFFVFIDENTKNELENSKIYSDVTGYEYGI